MAQNFLIKRCGLIFVLLSLILTGLFTIKSSVLAVGDPDSITINTQPSSTTSVDSVLSQQPVLLVQDADNSPLPGITVTAFKAGGLGSLKGNLTAVTNANGLAAFQGLNYNKTDIFTISFIYTGGSPITSNAIQLSPGAASASKSSISVNSSSVIADGESFATITISCKDKYGNVIPGAKVGVSSSGSDNTFSQPTSADSPGITTANLSSTKAESKIVSVTVNSVSIGQSSSINFVPGKIAKLSVSADSPVDTNSTSQITITGKDKFDNIVVNDSTTQAALSVDNGGSLDSALVTLSKGIAVASLSKKSAGTINFIASDGNINAQTKVVFTLADSSAPTILSQYPLGHAENVPSNVVPYINFSKTMDTTTMTDDNVQLRKFSDDSAVSVAILIANGGKKVVLQPDSSLDFNTKYYLYVSTSVKDSAGNALASLYSSDSFAIALSVGNSSSQYNNLVNQGTTSAASPNAGTTTNTATTTNTNTTENSVQGNGQNNAPENAVEGSSTNDTSAPAVESTVAPKTEVPVDSAAAYFEAGLMGALKNIDWNAFGNWFVSNFVWIISLIIIALGAYLSWFLYKNKK